MKTRVSLRLAAEKRQSILSWRVLISTLAGIGSEGVTNGIAYLWFVFLIGFF